MGFLTHMAVFRRGDTFGRCYCHQTMSTVDDKPRRTHDAERSRRALLAAASTLFEEKGYEATTVREIGERADVDPAMIARYFGGKEGLYLAAMTGTPGPGTGGDAHAFAERILTRHETQGAGPIGRAMVSATLSDAMRDQVSEILAARIVTPLAEHLRGRGVADAQLRAEMVVAATIGMSLVRAGGTLPALSAASTADVLAQLAPAIDALCGALA